MAETGKDSEILNAESSVVSCEFWLQCLRQSCSTRNPAPLTPLAMGILKRDLEAEESFALPLPLQMKQ